MNKNINKIIFTFITLVLWFICSANSASAYIDEGPILWASGTNVMQRTYSDITGKLGTPVVAISGVSAKYIIVKASPVKKEFILGIQDAAGNLRAYHSLDGITWTFDWTVAIGDGNVARFDVAFEGLSGRAIIAYRGRILTLRTTFYYRIWNGSTWTAQTEMRSTVATYTGNIVSMQLAGRPGSNQIGMVYDDDLYYAVAAFWSGTAWTFAPLAVTTNGTRYTGYAGTYPPLSNSSVAFETTAGDMLVVAGQNTADRLHYLTRTAAGAWGTVSIFNTLTGYGDYSKLVPSPTTNDIALTSCMMEPNTPAYKCDFVIWNGTAFGTVSSDSATGPVVAGDAPTDALWLSNVSTRLAAAVFDDSTTLGIGYQMSSYSGTFYPMTPDSSSPTITAHEGQISAVPLAGFAQSALVALTDVNNNVYMKKASINGTSIDWSSITGGSLAEITQGANLVNSSNFETVGFAFQQMPQALVIATTSANTRKLITAGTKAYLYSSTCTDETTCSAFTIDARGKNSFSVPRIMFTNTGTINLANTSGWELVIDNDINPNNGVQSTYTGTVSGNTITFNPYQYIASGQRLYAYLGATFGSNPYPAVGDTVTLGVNAVTDIDVTSATTTEKYIVNNPVVKGIIAPNITGYTNLTEGALSNVAGVTCLDCGGRIGSGSFAQQIQINGIGFGTATGTITISGATTIQIAASNIKSWSNTQIKFNLDSSVAGNTDSDFGTNYGGVGALKITAQAYDSDSLDFYLFPQITSVQNQAALGTNNVREYSSSDSDGIITITGTRFGSSAAAGQLEILGCSATTCTSPADSVTTTAWSNTSITAQVPVVIPDNLYTGQVTLTRNFPAGSNSTISNYANLISVKPRIKSLAPSPASNGDDLIIAGDHLCPTGGVCPTGSVGIDANLSASPQFSTADRVVIGGIVSDYFNYWTHSEIKTKVNSAVSMGATTATVTSGTYNAGSLPLTITITAIPGNVAGIKVYSGTSTLTLLNVGDYTSSSAITFGSVISATSSISSQMRMNVEVSPIGSSFVCGSTFCASALTGNWVLNQSTKDCSISSNNCSVSTTLAANAYHFRVRTELLVNGTTYYGSWVSYPDVGGNLESDPDFWIDNELPVIIGLTSSSIGTNNATISWDTNEKTDSLIQINKTGIFTNDCSLSNGCNASSTSYVLTKSFPIKNLSSNTTYFYRVRARDPAGNTTWSSVMQFNTLAVEKPAKMLFFHVMSNGGYINAGQNATTTFDVVIPELNPEFKSIFIDIRGMYTTSGVQPNAGITLKINNGTDSIYRVPGGRSIISPFRIFHKLNTVNISPTTNTIKVTSNADTNLSGVSADIIISYLYTP